MRRRSAIFRKVTATTAVVAGAILLAGYLFVGPDVAAARRMIERSSRPTHPDIVKAAFVAAEDPDFFDHRRFHALRSLGSAFSGGREAGHASLTRQVVLQTGSRQHRGILRVSRELLVETLLEETTDRAILLDFFLNNVYLGMVDSKPINGVTAGAAAYFGKRPASLTAAEAATLAAMVRGPQRFSPLVDPQALVDRRNDVLRAMADAGTLTSSEAETAVAAPLGSPAGGKGTPERERPR